LGWDNWSVERETISKALLRYKAQGRSISH